MTPVDDGYPDGEAGNRSGITATEHDSPHRSDDANDLPEDVELPSWALVRLPSAYAGPVGARAADS